MARFGQLSIVLLIALAAAAYFVFSQAYRGDKQALMEDLRVLSERLGKGSIPLYIGLHALLISLCLPYAVVMEAGAAYLFGFFHGVLCVFAAKILSSSLSFWIGRTVFQSSPSARQWVQGNKFFRVISDGVSQDGWKFVLLARFSPIPSYVINYSLAATNVRYGIDFLLPSILGCIPMILQNTSIGSLTRAATHIRVDDKKSGMMAYVLPTMGLSSSVLIAWRIKKYTSKVMSSGTPVVSSNNMPKSSHENTTTTEQPGKVKWLEGSTVRQRNTIITKA